jgi:glutamine cyclotransferase
MADGVPTANGVTGQIETIGYRKYGIVNHRLITAALLSLMVTGAVLPVSCSDAAEVSVSPDSPVFVYGYRTVNAYRHDPAAFTQGLAFADGWLYEGTGRRGQSTLRRVELESGIVRQLYQLPDRFFGEGVTVFGDRIIQLSWQSGTGFVYDRRSFARLEEFSYSTEGWGLTHDGKSLILSDGSATLRFLDPETFAETGQVEVFDSDGPVTKLNELEYVKGEIYANVWPTDRIARIDPATGRVAGWIDLTGLLRPEEYPAPIDVLNGIAYDAAGDRLFVTGKLWPRLFEIELIPPSN